MSRIIGTEHGDAVLTPRSNVCWLIISLRAEAASLPAMFLQKPLQFLGIQSVRDVAKVHDANRPSRQKPALTATGRTGSKEYVPGRDTPRGTEYSYIDAHFQGATGAGTRVEGRPCSLQFDKQ